MNDENIQIPWSLSHSLPPMPCECICVEGISMLSHLVSDGAQDILQGDLYCYRNMSQNHAAPNLYIAFQIVTLEIKRD